MRMYIEKFKSEVTINEDDPLAVEQRAKDAAPKVVKATPEKKGAGKKGAGK